MTDAPSFPGADELVSLRAEVARLRATVDAIAERIGLPGSAEPTPQEDADDDRDADLWRRLGLAHDERRLVTVLFADVCGFTELGERLDPEEFQLVMRDAMAGLAACVQAEGGYVEKFIGDAVCAIFGAPTAHEDEPQRAARAAAAMHALLAERSLRRPDLPPLQLHAGINTGIVVAGAVGDGTQFGVMGDTINTAHRLMGLAQADQTFASAHTARRIRRQFGLVDRGLQAVKGRQAALAVFEVGEPLDADLDDHDRFRAGLVGRDAEIDELSAMLVSAARGRGALTVLTGEAGVGKSRLAAELARRVEIDWRVLRASARLAGDLPGAAVVSALGPLLGDRVDVDSSPPGALTEALTEAAEARPVLVVMDDADHADDATVSLLAELVDGTRASAVAWVVVGRRVPPILARVDGVGVLRVEPLDGAAGASLVAGLLPGAFTPGEAARLSKRAEGNPGFAEEIALELIDEGIVVELPDGTYKVVGDPDAVPIPGSVTELIEARIDAMATAARVTLQEASVIGMQFRRRLIERLASLPAQIGAALTELAAEELITPPDEGDPDGFWSFRSQLIREVAYHGILRRRRPPAHRRVAEALLELEADQEDENAELIAHHFELSDRPELALPYFERATRHAAALVQPAAADALARRALAIARRRGDDVDARLVAFFEGHLDPALG